MLISNTFKPGMRFILQDLQSMCKKEKKKKHHETYHFGMPFFLSNLRLKIQSDTDSSKVMKELSLFLDFTVNSLSILSSPSYTVKRKEKESHLQ